MPCTFVCIFSCQSVLPKVICIALFRRNSYVYIYKSLFISFLFCTYMYICHFLTQSLLWSFLYFFISYFLSFFSFFFPPPPSAILFRWRVPCVVCQQQRVICFVLLKYDMETRPLCYRQALFGTGLGQWLAGGWSSSCRYLEEKDIGTRRQGGKAFVMDLRSRRLRSNGSRLLLRNGQLGFGYY